MCTCNNRPEHEHSSLRVGSKEDLDNLPQVPFYPEKTIRNLDVLLEFLLEIQKRSQQK